MVSSLIQHLLQLVYPSYCYQCYNLVPQELVFCAHCFASIKPVVSLQIPVATKKVVSVFAGGAYQEPLKNLVLAKFKRDVLASKYLAQILIHHLSPSIIEKIDVLVPIPLHWTRYAQRGYNQAFIMAKTLAHHYNRDTISILRRVKRTKLQARLSKIERQKNLDQAFVCNPLYKKYVENKHVALVDDLYTTGSTVISAAKALFKAGAYEVTVLVGSRKIE